MKTYAVIPLSSLVLMTNHLAEANDEIGEAARRGETLILVKPMTTTIDLQRADAMEKAIKAGRREQATDPWSKLMAALDDLKAAVSKNTTVIESALTFIGGIKDRVGASSDPDMQALASELNSESDKLAAAIVENTKAAAVEPSTEAPAEAPAPDAPTET